jgi:hypothetical protein
VLDYESDKKMYMVTVTADDGTGADNATGSIAMLDYETMDSHTVTVTASDDEGSDSIEVTIMVIDNTPPAFPASDTAEVMVEENQEAGTAVGDPVTAFDVEGDTVTYFRPRPTVAWRRTRTQARLSVTRSRPLISRPLMRGRRHGDVLDGVDVLRDRRGRPDHHDDGDDAGLRDDGQPHGDRDGKR